MPSKKTIPCKYKGCKALVSGRSKSGLCAVHQRKHYRATSEVYKRNHRRQAEENKTWRIERSDKFPLGKWTTCHNSKNPHINCQNRFRLEWWQHPQMAWCAECRDTDEYQYGNTGVLVYKGGFHDNKGRYVQRESAYLF